MTAARALAILLAAMATPAHAGPPFLTDDPEPVEFRHWEVYAGSQGTLDRHEAFLTAPHFEVNYGVVPEVQLHLIAPLALDRPEGGPSRYGFSDTELGAKVRFVRETRARPQVGIFPHVELPTGDASDRLGHGEAQAFFPVWIQKSRGPWTTYGGGGYWINPGEGSRDFWFFGWEAQRAVTGSLTVGAEVFHQTASTIGGEASSGFNAGAILDLSELQHVMLSAGRSGGATLYYVAYQLTVGPRRIRRTT